MKKLIVILGPTASGKTALSIRLAKKYGGEIVSADSRQVYQGLNIGSGKITKREMKGIPHHLLDVADPKRKFTVAQYQKLATKAVHDIQSRNNIPFLVGGTGFYIQSVVDGIILPEVKPNRALRARLSKKSVAQLFSILKKLDSARTKTIDSKNPARLIRAIEIVTQTKKPIALIKKAPQFDVLEIGINLSKEKYRKILQQSQAKRFKQGLITEVKKLRTSGLSWKRLEELGLEYRLVAQYLQNKLTKAEMQEKLQKEIWKFAKRQMTWFNRNKRIRWIRNPREAEALVGKFLKIE